MKKLVCLVFVALVVALSLCTAFAHGGGTDGNGGHYDQDSGEYHYHHGYSAHQHKNGECPYEDSRKSSEEANDDGIDWYTDDQPSGNTKNKVIFTINNLPDKFYVDYDWCYLDVLHLVLTIILDVSLIFCYIQYLYKNRKDDDFYVIFSVTTTFILWVVASLTLSLCMEFSDAPEFILTIPFYLIGLIAIPIISYFVGHIVSYIVEKVRGY